MTAKILKSILSVAIAVLITTLFVITGLLYSDHMEVQQEQLKEELVFAAVGTEQMGYEYLLDLPKKDFRITWIDKNGNVLYDNMADTQLMGNHLNREEIQEALKDDTGSSSRYSDTLTEKTLYEAILLKDGSVLRLSASRRTAAVFMIDLIIPIIIIGLCATLLSYYLAHVSAKQVVEPLNKLDLDHPLSNNTYEELYPLLKRLYYQHKEIEKQIQLIKHRKEEFNQITSNMKEALILLDSNHNIISINPAGRNLFNVPNDYKGKRLDNKDYNQYLKNAIQQAEKEEHSECIISIHENKYMINVSTIKTNNSIHGIVILAFDITEQANAEQLRRDFTSNVSHELKTPLQSIIGSAELIENGIVEDKDLPRFIGHIRKEATRLVSLIEDILLLSKLDAAYNMPMEHVSLLSISKEVLEVLQFEIQEKQLYVSIPENDVSFYGVKSLLFELIYNLMDNAIRYNKEKGSIYLDLTDDNNTIVLTVKDTGIGIPKEHHQKIFERFYRVDKSHSRQSGGTGLGLSIVKHAVKYHDGIINIESEINKGTQITVTFKKAYS